MHLPQAIRFLVHFITCYIIPNFTIKINKLPYFIIYHKLFTKHLVTNMLLSERNAKKRRQRKIPQAQDFS